MFGDWGGSLDGVGCAVVGDCGGKREVYDVVGDEGWYRELSVGEGGTGGGRDECR